MDRHKNSATAPPPLALSPPPPPPPCALSARIASEAPKSPFPPKKTPCSSGLQILRQARSVVDSSRPRRRRRCAGGVRGGVDAAAAAAAGGHSFRQLNPTHYHTTCNVVTWLLLEGGRCIALDKLGEGAWRVCVGVGQQSSLQHQPSPSPPSHARGRVRLGQLATQAPVFSGALPLAMKHRGGELIGLVLGVNVHTRAGSRSLSCVFQGPLNWASAAHRLCHKRAFDAFQRCAGLARGPGCVCG
jgi:hypothetical protein